MKITIKRILAVIVIISMVVSMVSCSDAPAPTMSDSNNEVIVTEKVEEEKVITEDIVTELIETEAYVDELILVENSITELLLEEETITEVSVCKTIYVPQENIDEFSEHSQTNKLFGENVNIKSVLSKVAIGTGVILTVTVLKSSKVPKPVASIVVSAAEETVKSAKWGTVIGSLFGGFTGAGDAIDEDGRISAMAGFALATAGLIFSIVSLAAEIPSGGTSSFGVVEGIHLAFAGIRVLTMAIGEVLSARDMVKTFISADAADIDWGNIDWEKVGVSAVQKTINNGADGYMWGTIYGLIDGTVEGLYQKFSTPYSKYIDRWKQTPKNDEYGHWSGDRGESEYIYDRSKTIKIGNKTYEIEAGTKVKYQNGVPDFSPFQEAQVKIPHMTSNRTDNFNQADDALAEYWTKIKYKKKAWTGEEVEKYRTSNGFTWHEMNNMESMQLVPTEINGGFGHLGGVGEYNALIGKEGVTQFD